MTFGTSSNARLLNLLPLRKRFRADVASCVALWGSGTDATNERILRSPQRWGVALRADSPGWDADGREVET